MDQVLESQDHSNSYHQDQNGDMSPADADHQRMTEELKYQKLTSSVSVGDFLAESRSQPDIELRSSRPGEVAVPANRIVLAAVSPFFKQCLADVEGGQDTVSITVTDSCHASLSLVMQYIYNGFVTITQQIMKDKVQTLISRLQIGDFSISQHLAKFDPSDGSAIPLVKCETEDNAVNNYYNFINRISKQNESQALKRKKKTDNEWKSQVINTLYKDDEMELKDEDFVEEEVDDDDYYSDDEEEYEKPKSKPKSASKKYGCKTCGSKFSSQERLESHTQRKHSSQKLKCEHCPKTFTRASDKRVHEEVHSKPYKCDECDASFGRKSNLIGHLRMHRGERPYMCDICGKSFPMQSSVTTHKRQSHPTGVKPWVCEFCERRLWIFLAICIKIPDTFFSLDLSVKVSWSCTAEFTQERSLGSVIRVGRDLHRSRI